MSVHKLERGKKYLLVTTFMGREAFESLKEKLLKTTGAKIIDLVTVDKLNTLNFFEAKERADAKYR